ncbi:MAG TPA: PAS domain S-box protein, partial [Actinomycetota bacterium]|nr:PAS domain S-box protein [Actinomycetota bacterium]
MRPGAVRGELDRAVAAAVRPLAAALAVAYAALLAVRMRTPPHPWHELHVWVTAAVVLASLSLVVALGRREVPPGRGHAVAVALAAVVLAGATVDLAVEGPRETIVFILVVVGAGALFLSPRWLAAVLAAAWACWLPVAAVRGAPDPVGWAGFGAYLLAATGLAAIVHRERRRMAVGLAARSAELAEVAGRLRAIVEGSPLAIVGVDLEGTVTFWSPAAERLLGWRSEEAVGRFLPHVGPEAMAEYRERRARILRGEPVVLDEVVRRRKDGSAVRVSLSVAPIRDERGRVTGSVSVLADLTERWEAEEARRRAEERYRTLVEQLPAVAYIWDTRDPGEPGAFHLTSPRVRELLGYTPEEWDGDPELWKSRLHPDDRDRVLEATERCYRTGEPFDLEYRYLARDGREVWVHDRAVLLERGADGRPLVFQGVMLDVTERKRAEAELRATLERYRVLAEEVPVGVFLADARGRDVWTNERWSAITGLPRGEATGTGFARAIHPEDRPRAIEAWTRATAAGTAFEDEFRLLRPDGSVRWVHVRAAPVGEEGDEGRFLGVVEDVTDRRRAEELLRRSEAELRWRLAALRERYEERRLALAAALRAQEEELARMAGGIEDDHLQQVAALGMRLEALRRRLSDEAQLEALDGLDRTVREVAGGLRELLAELRPRELETGGLADAIGRAAAATLGSDVVVAVDDGLPSEPDEDVRIAAFRIAQEALRDARAHAGLGRIEVRLARDGEALLLEVVDDGAGPAPRGPAVAAMRERAELLGGSLQVRPAGAAGGTVVRCRLPWR